MTALVASPAVRKERREICLRCEHMKGVKLAYCSLCKCPIVTKTTLATASCPLPQPKW